MSEKDNVVVHPLEDVAPREGQPAADDSAAGVQHSILRTEGLVKRYGKRTVVMTVAGVGVVLVTDTVARATGAGHAVRARAAGTVTVSPFLRELTLE